MKKTGFTLAEVLITLTIIGVVATLTLPSLMANTAEQQAVTGYRKAINTLNEVVQMSSAVDGFNYSDISNTMNPSTSASLIDGNGATVTSIWAMMATRAQVDKIRSDRASNGQSIGGGCAGRAQIFFRDGTVLCYTNRTTSGNPNAVIDGVIDTNGAKAPNRISGCNDADCKPSGRSIGDQFPVSLHGAVAYPGIIYMSNDTPTEGSDSATLAALWAMRK